MLGRPDVVSTLRTTFHQGNKETSSHYETAATYAYSSSKREETGKLEETDGKLSAY